MEWIREYILSVTVAAIVCAIIRGLLAKKGTPASMGKLLTGIFMTLTILNPLVELTPGRIGEFAGGLDQQADAAVNEGEKIAANALLEDITERMRTYILEKADTLGANIQVELQMSNAIYPTPQRVTIRGDVSPYAKMRLKQVLQELGIAEEDQIWI